MTHCIIRKPLLADAENIARAHVKAWQETYRGIMPDDFLDSLSLETRIQNHKKSIPEIGYLIAEEAGEILGFICYGQSRDSKDAKDGEIFAINMIDKGKGRGIAAEMMRRATVEMAASGWKSLSLWVVEGNARARGFYEKMGGVTNGEEKTRPFGGRDVTEVKYVFKEILPVSGL